MRALCLLAALAIGCGEPTPEEGTITKLGDVGGCALYRHRDRWKEVRFIVCPAGKTGAVHE